MDWVRRKTEKQKESLKNKTLKKKPFQKIRNWITNTKSSFKNYFGKKKANKEGRPFHSTMTAAESRKKMETFGLAKRHTQGLFKNEQQPELTEKNTERLEEVNLGKIKIPVGNKKSNGNFTLPIKNSLNDAKEHLRAAERNLREMQNFDSRLKEKKFLYEKQEFISQNEAMLQKTIEEGKEELDQALKAARAVKNEEKTPDFKKNEANDLTNEIVEVQEKFDNYYQYFDSMYEYTNSMARRNLEHAIYMMSKRGTAKNVPKAREKLRVTKNNARSTSQIMKNTTLIGEHGELLASFGRKGRVATMEGRRGGATRKRTH